VSRRSGLGRGIGSLIPTELIQAEGSELRDVPTSSVVPNRYQPRRRFDEDSLTSLAESIRVMGVLQPILVRPLDDDRFELVAGERRWRAAQRAGLGAVPAIVRTIDDTTSIEQALVENLHREDLSPLEEAAAYQQLMEDFGFTQEQVAQRVGKSRSSVANTLRLLQLPPAIQRLLDERKLSAGHARALLGTPDRAFQEAFAARIAGEGLSVREVEEAIRRRSELEARLASAGAASDAARDLPAPPRHEEPGNPPAAGLLELEQLLADYLDTSVRVVVGPGRGRLQIDFADLEDLERIYRLIADTE
jgi:ParB family transcriptional regulator, chromosome partitioning protein